MFYEKYSKIIQFFVAFFLMKNFKANKILIKWKCGIFLKLKCYRIKTSYAVLIQYRIIETKVIIYYIELY